jgi:hypothetical protein
MRSAWKEAVWSIVAAIGAVLVTTAYLIWTLSTPGFGAPGFVALGVALLMGFVLIRRFRQPRQ